MDINLLDTFVDIQFRILKLETLSFFPRNYALQTEAICNLPSHQNNITVGLMQGVIAE